MPKPLPEHKGPRDVIVKAGQSLVLHDGSKVLVNVKATKEVRYFTAWQSIVGTEAEVTSKVAFLGLK